MKQPRRIRTAAKERVDDFSLEETDTSVAGVDGLNLARVERSSGVGVHLVGDVFVGPSWDRRI